MLKKFLSYILLISISFGISEGAIAYNYTSNYNKNYYISNNNSNVIIYKNGVSIDGKYYTKAQFERLLENAYEIESNVNSNGYETRIFPAIPAGTYIISGIGEVVISKAGEIIIKGVVISAGTWVYMKVKEFFEKKEKEKQEKQKKDYEKAILIGKKTDNHKDVKYNGKDVRNLPAKGEPYSSKDLKKDGKTVQRRYYDKNGNAQVDIDYAHTDGDGSHIFPHRHDWYGTTRGPAYITK